LCASHFQNVFEFSRLTRKRNSQNFHRFDQQINFKMQRHFDSGRIHIICALTQIHLFKRM